MISEIVLQNIQSHKETKLQLCRGINAIVGSSNNGKSAILRALNWAIKNRPLGTDILLSHWATDEKGNQKEPMSIEIRDDVGNTLIRKRTKTENQYIVNGKELNVIKTDVPEEVNRFFRLSDTNIQSQQDSPFLLSLSSGEVARYFNKTVKLDMIDRILSNAESKKRKLKTEKELTEDTVKYLEEKIASYDWLDKVEIILNKYLRVKERYENLTEVCDSLTEEINKLHSQKTYDFTKQSETINKIKEENLELENLLASYIILCKNCGEIKLNKTYNLEKQKKIIDEITEIIKGSRPKYDAENLQEDLEEIILCNKDIQDCNSEIDELWIKLPETCPVCGKPLDINKKC